MSHAKCVIKKDKVYVIKHQNDKFALWEITDIHIHVQTLLHKRNLGNARGQMPLRYFSA